MVWGELVFWKKYVFKRWEELFVGKRKEKYSTGELSWAAEEAAQEAEQALGWPVKVEVDSTAPGIVCSQMWLLVVTFHSVWMKVYLGLNTKQFF